MKTYNGITVKFVRQTEIEDIFFVHGKGIVGDDMHEGIFGTFIKYPRASRMKEEDVLHDYLPG